MDIKIFEKEKYKIIEKTDYTIVIPKDKNYDFCLFFFAGFNEKAIKYAFIFKSFFEYFIKVYPSVKFKVIIPNLPKIKDYNRMFLNNKNKSEETLAWFNFKAELQENNKYHFEIINEKKTDDLILNLVNIEYEKFKKDSEKLIFAGFSLGGRYLFYLNSILKFKLNFIFCFKSLILNSKKNLEEDLKFLSNKIYLYYSTGDKIINFENGLLTYRNIKKDFKNTKIQIDIDNNHSVDNKALEYFAKILKLNTVKDNKF